MTEIFKQYPKHSSYEVGNNGTIKHNGKIIRDSTNTKPVFINGSFVSIAELMLSVLNAKQELPKQDKQPSKLVHGNTGRKHTVESKQKMKANRPKKQVTVNSVAYNSITEASEQLNVNRSTIYRKHKKALPT